jgi:hypothetical protein
VPELPLHSQHLRSLSRVLKLVCFIYLVHLVYLV